MSTTAGGFGEPGSHLSTCTKNVINLFVLVGVGMPAVLAGAWIASNPNCAQYSDNEHVAMLCDIGVHRPLLFVNILLLLIMCVLFWIVSLLQGSCWLIDAYWTLAPVLIAAFYKHHPSAINANNWMDVTNPATWRSNATFALLLLWSARLTHSYLRREHWALGAKEDWRFTDMRKKLGGPVWAIVSFFYAFLSQQPLLFGLTLPLYIVNLHGDHLPPPLSAAACWTLPLGPLEVPLPIDIVVLGLAVAGLAIADAADRQLFRHVEANVGRAYLGLPPVPVLNTGLWALSRHPNYFGEALWWGALSVGYGCCLPSLSAAGPDGEHDQHCWIVGGWLLNLLVMLVSMQMIEARMVDGAQRGAEKATKYRHYQDYTSMLVPWWNSQAKYLAAVDLDDKLRKRT